jgi:hypothetical protein
MQRLITLIIIIFVISQIIGRVKRGQQQDKQEKRPPARIPIKLPWEFETEEEIPLPEKQVEVKMPTEQPRKADDEYSGDEHIAVSDEESFSDKSAAHDRPSEPKSGKPSVPAGRKPAQIAGIPINTKTISQGIIISEILRRPRF